MRTGRGFRRHQPSLNPFSRSPSLRPVVVHGRINPNPTSNPNDQTAQTTQTTSSPENGAAAPAQPPPYGPNKATRDELAPFAFTWRNLNPQKAGDPPEAYLPHLPRCFHARHLDPVDPDEACRAWPYRSPDAPDTYITAYDLAPWDFWDCGPWHAALTLPRQEKTLAHYLHAAGLPYYIPYKRRRTHDRHFVSVPLFSGIVFVGAGDAGTNFVKFDMPTRAVCQQLSTARQFRLSAELAALAQEPMELRLIRCAQAARRNGQPNKDELLLLEKLEAAERLTQVEQMSSPDLAGVEVTIQLGSPQASRSTSSSSASPIPDTEPFTLTGRVSQECAALLQRGSRIRPKVAIDIEILGQSVVLELPAAAITSIGDLPTGSPILPARTEDLSNPNRTVHDRDEALRLANRAVADWENAYARDERKRATG